MTGEPLEMTGAQWRAMRRDYRTIIRGQRYVLRLNKATGYTELVPVRLVSDDKGTTQ